MDLQSGKVKTVADFNPQTFMERGVVVGFTKPEFFLSRVRSVGKDNAELIVRNISGGKGYYIVNWKGLPDVMPLTMHDAMLYEEICRLGFYDPITIRKAGLAVAKKGFAGSAAAEAAAALEAKDRDQILLTQFGLIAALLSASGIENVTLISVAMATPAQQDRLKGALKNVAPAVGADPLKIFQLVEAIAEALYPIGVANSPAQGRLRETVKAMREMEAAMNVLVAEEPPECRAVVKHLAQSAHLNIKIMLEVLRTIDDMVGDIIKFVKLWIAHEASVREILTRGAWLLDGWDHLVNLWRTSVDADVHTRRQALEEAASLTPVIPREAFKWLGMDADTLSFPMFTHKKWFKAGEDWRGAVTGVERMARNETLLARRA